MKQDDRQIRFALVIDGDYLPNWQCRCLESLLAERVELALVIRPRFASSDSESHGGLKHLLFSVFQATVGRLSSMRRVSPRKLIRNAESRNCSIIDGVDGLHTFHESDAYDIGQANLDFILYMGERTFGGSITQAATLGFWHFSRENPENPPCFSEMLTGEDVVQATLLNATRAGNVLLKRGVLKLTHHSYTRSANELLCEMAKWPAQVCRELNAGIPLPTDAVNEPSHSSLTPDNWETLRFLAKLASNIAAVIWEKLFHYEQWSIGLIQEPIQTFASPDFQPKIKWLPVAGKGKFFADPFGVERDGERTILCEYYDYRTAKGVISAIPLTQDDSMMPSEIVIEFPFHTAYPFLLEHNGEIYCIPETRIASEIRLYKAVRFPLQWEKVCTLVENVPAVDSTIFQHDGLWWLMYGENDDKLHILHAPELLGPWTPHPRNPVKIDIRAARPAGKVFEHEDQLYRPAQDCSATYGGAIRLHRITRLTPTDFAEEEISIIAPDARGPYPHGLHTLTTMGNSTIIDGKRFVFSPFGIITRIRQLIAKRAQKKG